MMEIKQLAWTMRNWSGEATLVILNPIAGKPLSPTAMNDYITDVSKYTVTWASLKEIASGLSLPARLTDMIAKVDSVFFDPDYATLRMKTLTALIAGQPPGTNTDEWSKISIIKQAPIQDTATIALDVAKDHAADLHSRALWSLIVQLCLMLCAITGVAAMMWVVSFRVSNPLHQLSAAMRKLAGGDFDVVLPGLERKDEIGAMANAVEEFKVVSAEKARSETEEVVRRQQAEAEIQAKAAAEQRKAAEAQTLAAQEQAKIVRLLAEGLVKMSEGELGHRLGEGFTESYRQIKDDFNAMGMRLHETIGAIAGATREISNASEELSASTTDLSQRTEEQAASLEQTSASMEEISSTVRLNAENAQRATNRASRGARRCRSWRAGGRQGGRRHGAHRGLFPEDLRHHRRDRRDCPADQSARAQCRGRGRARRRSRPRLCRGRSEVRSLAQRSSQAAKDIKDLITSSSGQVKDGVDLVNKAGTALHEIVDSIKQVVQIVSDIAAAAPNRRQVSSRSTRR